jgi:hypothetical protein
LDSLFAHYETIEIFPVFVIYVNTRIDIFVNEGSIENFEFGDCGVPIAVFESVARAVHSGYRLPVPWTI